MRQANLSQCSSVAALPRMGYYGLLVGQGFLPNNLKPGETVLFADGTVAKVKRANPGGTNWLDA
jgi:hypothetical protein